MRQPSPRTIRWLGLAAAVSMGICLVVENVLGSLHHPAISEMRRASALMQIASQVIRARKHDLGILQGPDIDPNRTGLLGPELTSLTTTLGSPGAKRTATNPDLAAALVRTLWDADVPREGWALVVTSGSIVGANIAVLAALDALGMESVALTSVGASMYGAGDPELTWLDMQALLAETGIGARPALAVAGGDGGVASDLTSDGRDAILAVARRTDTELVAEDDLERLVDGVDAAIMRLKPTPPAVLINVGGSSLALGTCTNIEDLVAGLSYQPVSCIGGVPGLIATFSQRGVPVLHILNMREFAGRYGLPYDPIPLPTPGDNKLVYGGGFFGPPSGADT